MPDTVLSVLMQCLHMHFPPLSVDVSTLTSESVDVPGDVQRNEGKEAWGMGINFKFPWQKKKEKKDAQDKADKAAKAKR